MSVKLVLFDIDGTLIQSGGAGEKAFGLTCAGEFGIPDAASKLHFAGRTDTGIVRRFFESNSIEASPENFQRFFDYYVFCLDHLLPLTSGRVLPGAHELIRDLSQLDSPPLVGLLTGNIRLGAQIKLSHYHLWDRFVVGGFGDDSEHRNQIARIARDRGAKLLEKKLQGDEVLVIGDTPLDIECGQAIQARILAVATGSYSAAQLKSLQPRWTAESLHEISVDELCR